MHPTGWIHDYKWSHVIRACQYKNRCTRLISSSSSPQGDIKGSNQNYITFLKKLDTAMELTDSSPSTWSSSEINDIAISLISLHDSTVFSHMLWPDWNMMTTTTLLAHQNCMHAIQPPFFHLAAWSFRQWKWQRQKASRMGPWLPMCSGNSRWWGRTKGAARSHLTI
jgi:hypothetical protein